MGNIWIATDLHLYSRDNDSRHPFRSRHNIGKLSDQFAQDIQEDDLLIFLGDLCDPDVTDTDKLAAIVQQIPCRKLMCRGNHDIQDDEFYLRVGFDEVTEVIRLYNIVFSHKPIKVAADEINIHGHLHTEKLVTMGYNHINAYAANWNKDDHPVLLEDLLRSAVVQEHEYTDKELAHVTEKFEKYTSLENDQYTKIMDISDWFPLCPVDEAIDIMPTSELAKIAAFCKWMDKNFQYGLRINGRWDPKRNTSSEDWDKYLVVQSPQEIEKSKVGVCWDYVSYEAWYFQKNFPGVSYKTYYMQFFNDEDCPSHTFLTFELNGKHYYFESSFRKYAGIYEANSEEDIINFVLKLMSDNPDPSIPKGELLRKWKYDAWEYDALDSALFGMHCQEYMNHVMDNGRCLYHHYRAAKTLKKLNWDVIHESRDIIDEVLFKDVDDTKYWLKDDKEYREQAEKGEQSDKSVAAIDETVNHNAEWNDQSLYYVCSENMDDELLPAGKCVFPTVTAAAEYWAFDPRVNAGPGEYWVHNVIPGYLEIRSSDEVFGAYWSTENIELNCQGKIEIYVGADGKRYMRWVFMYDDQGRAIYCRPVDENANSRQKRLLHSSFNDVKSIVDRIPKEEHHFFYHGEEFKDSSNVVYRKIVKERRRDGGAAFIDVYAFKDAPDTGIVVIAATPNGRGHGLTDSLINSACHELTSIGITRLIWRCDIDNKASYELAKRHEFIDITKPGADQYKLERIICGSKIDVPSVKELYHGSPNRYQTLKAQASPAYPDQPAVFATPMYEFALAFAGNPWSDLQINQCMHDGKHVLTEILPKQFDQCFNRPGYIHVLKPDGFAPFGRISEWTCPTDVKPIKVKQVTNVLDELQKSGTVLYHYPDLPPWIPDRKKYMATIIKKYNMTTTVDKLCKMYSISETAVGILDEMAYEDATDFMLTKLKRLCREYNKKDKYFDQIRKKWKKENPDFGEPPKLEVHLAASSDNQLRFTLADVNIDNATVGQVAVYWDLVKAIENDLKKDKEVKDFKYITRINAEAEDFVGMFVDLMGIGAFGADDPEVSWPNIRSSITKSTNPNDPVSQKAYEIKFYNDQGKEVGEVCISGYDTDTPYLYNLEVYPRYRGKNYGNAIMRCVMKEYRPTELCVEWKNEIAQKLYERFGFKKDSIIEDYHTTLIVMRTKRKYTGSFKSNEESISESAVLDENFIGTVPDLEWHRDEWAANDKNFLFICGLSGGGKTTLAKEISQETKCEVIHLDDLAQAAFVGKMANPDFRKRMSPTMQAYWNSTTNHIKMYAWGDQRLALETENFIQWMIKNHAKDGKLYIIEGCEIMYMDADYLIQQPLIIKGTSAVRTTFWRFKRTYGQHREKGENALKAFEHCMIQIMRIYKNGAMIAAENGLMRFKAVLKAARDYNELALAAMNESVADTHPVDREQKADIAKKYGLQAVGDTHAEEEAEEKERKRKEAEKAKLEKEKALEKKREDRNKALAKGRRTQKRNRIIKKVKSYLPGVKNEEADAVDGSDAAYIDYPFTEHDAQRGDREPLFKNHRDYADASLDESSHIYRFEMLDRVQFFDRIDESSADEKTPSPVYIVLINGNSPVSAAIRGLTGAEFTHVSISFDSSLTKMYSFAGKELESKIQSLIGGFKLENIKSEFYTKNKIPYAVYLVPSTKSAVKRMKKRLDYFIQHETKFTFDYLGLVKNFFKIPDNPENTWFCSRFVADILNAGTPGQKLIDQPSLYRPEDFKSAGFAQFIDSGLAANYNKKTVDQKTKMILRAKKLNEGVLDVSLDNPWAHQVLNYQLTMMSEAAVEDFITYLKSFKLRFDKDGNIVVTRREFDQLDTHFRSSLKTIKACENAGNVEGVKEELYKIHYMVELINQYYLRTDVKNLKPNAREVRKDMLDLRSVMLNAFQQHLKYVTTRDPRWNFQSGYDSSKYGKNITIPQKVITAIGKTVITALT